MLNVIYSMMEQVNMSRPSAGIISEPGDLITLPDATRQGFLDQAVGKIDIAAPFVEKALELWTALQTVQDVQKLLELPALRNELISAAGFSEKARQHLLDEELDGAVSRVLAQLFSEEGSDFRFGILAHYLLVRGDTFGGKVRNWIGALAQQQLASALIRALEPQEVSIERHPKSGKIRRIGWSQRLLLFDATSPLIKKNIDVILLERPNLDEGEPYTLINPDQYLACGELKGGIDPAGADEHWKTARSALERIRSHQAFDARKPRLFFVGAAIAEGMAREIYQALEDEWLDFAANLTKPEQVSALAEWLVSL